MSDKMRSICQSPGLYTFPWTFHLHPGLKTRRITLEQWQSFRPINRLYSFNLNQSSEDLDLVGRGGVKKLERNEKFRKWKIRDAIFVFFCSLVALLSNYNTRNIITPIRRLRALASFVCWSFYSLKPPTFLNSVCLHSVSLLLAYE